MKPLDGKHAVVIGGGTGIGLGSAHLLARDGAVVTLAGRTEAKLNDAAASIQREGGRARVAVCDAVQSPRSCDSTMTNSPARSTATSGPSTCC